MTGDRLRPDVSLTVEYSDETPFGGPMTQRLEDNLRHLFGTILTVAREIGPAAAVERSEELLAELRRHSDYLRLVDPGDPERLLPEVLYPDADLVRPTAITVAASGPGDEFRLDFDPALLAPLHDVFAALDGDGAPAEAPPGQLYETVLDALRAHDMLLPVGPDPATDDAWRSDLTFVGHNTVVVRSNTTQVVVDPWFLPESESYPASYQPIQRRELGRSDALLVTHSHPDHFDPGSLLRFHRRTPVIVPEVTRESMLATDMARRVHESGFEDVRILRWWEETAVGDIKIAATPFFGEQPTTGARWCPDVRNAGNTYLVRTPRLSCAFLADSGRDGAGDVRDVALAAYRRWGPVDVVFGGYRGWHLYPIQYVWSSLRRFLLFVPPELYSVRQSIMNATSDAVDTAEAWHAHYLAPYGDGGAPWYWRAGLGPDLSRTDGGSRTSWFFDPPPEQCVEELALRSAASAESPVESRVRPLVLRPGQSARMDAGNFVIIDAERHRWPWLGGSGG
ncbi:MBL fold metallo-hydrolase [Streptomyces canus]|uniref:MBL fold metallo-hydrolase n=1 Tax=Streptomyces canus TaxID=58343 RepID=UPI002E2ADA4F|nr:MBL fold metallo-hydrolase [Streptomyces canus]